MTQHIFASWDEFSKRLGSEVGLSSAEIASLQFLEELGPNRLDLQNQIAEIVSDKSLFIFDAGILSREVDLSYHISLHEEFVRLYDHFVNSATAGDKVASYVASTGVEFPPYGLSNLDLETFERISDVYTGPGYKLGWQYTLESLGHSALDSLVLFENAIPNAIKVSRATFLSVADKTLDSLEDLSGLEQIQALSDADEKTALLNVTIDFLSGIIEVVRASYEAIEKGSLTDLPDAIRAAGVDLLNFFIGSAEVAQVKTFNALNVGADALSALNKLQESLDKQIDIEGVSAELEASYSLSVARFLGDEVLSQTIQSGVDLFQAVTKLVKLDNLPLVEDSINVIDALIDTILDSNEAAYLGLGSVEERGEQALELVEELIASVTILNASQLTRVNVYSEQLDVFGLKPLPEAPDAVAEQILNDDDANQIGVLSIQAPTHDIDAEIDFSLNLSTSGVGTQYRVALIIDVSGSMGGSRLIEAKAAYVDLINYLKDQGIADVTEFAVIPFQSSATLYEALSADEAIGRINTLSAGGGTEFGSAISRGLEFFDGTSAGLTQIAYFLSDGQGAGASTALQAVADVRAFGIGSGASISSLNTIDSNNAVILNSASDLAASFTESEIKTADVDRIEVYLNGTIAQTITGDQLTDNGATGLTFSGTINGLDTSNADTLEARVFFQDTSIPAQSVAFEIGDGVTEAAGTDGDDNIAFSLSQKTVDAGGGIDTVLANDLDNTVIKISGNGVIKTFGGNDMVHAGDNRSSGLDRVIDGGDGTDTVVYVGNYSEYTVSQTGGLIKVGTATDSLSNVEFLQFDDVKVRTSDLSVVQTLSSSAAEVTEGDNGTQQITFTVTLDAVSAIDVTFDYATANGTAEAGSDFTATSGSITLLAGETQKTVTVDIIGDAIFEGDETFDLQLSNANGAVFDGGSDTYSITGTIKNDDDANQVEIGSAGDDVINTGKGNDQINSGAGNDVVNANLGNDVVVDGLGNNSLNGDGGADAVVALSGINTATGGDGSDYLAGGFQSDNLNGGAGNDVIRGDVGGFLGGSDVLTGGTGDDFLMGGRGADTFIFNTNGGSDTIATFDVADMGFGPLSGYTATATGTDFQSGVDHIQLTGFSTVDASNVISSVTDGADGAVFSAEGTDITFYGLAANQLTADDFIFV